MDEFEILVEIAKIPRKELVAVATKSNNPKLLE